MISLFINTRARTKLELVNWVSCSVGQTLSSRRWRTIPADRFSTNEVSNCGPRVEVIASRDWIGKTGLVLDFENFNHFERHFPFKGGHCVLNWNSFISEIELGDKRGETSRLFRHTANAIYFSLIRGKLWPVELWITGCSQLARKCVLPVLEDKWRGRNMLQMYCSMQLEVFRSVIGRLEISRLYATWSVIFFFFFFFLG